MGESEQRAAVVAEAMSWVGTPYHHCADVKGAGVDCAMLLVRCFVDVGVLEPFDPRPYPHQWHQHADRERYLEWLGRFGTEVQEPDLGDVAIWRFGRTFSHAAIVVAPPHRIVHAEARSRRCSIGDMRESSLRGRGQQRPVRFFSPWRA